MEERGGVTVSRQKTKPIPAGHTTVTPHLSCSDARKEIQFLERALGAEVRQVMPLPDSNKVMHAEVKIGGSPVSLYLYVKDVDAAFARARDAGGEVEYEPTDMFWGDRMGVFRCPEGYQWTLATHVHDYTPEEISE